MQLIRGKATSVGLAIAAAFAAPAMAVFLAFELGYVVELNDPKFVRNGIDARLNGHLFTGVAYELYPSHRPRRWMTFNRGLQTGKEIHWYPNGNRWLEKSWVKGLPHGDFMMWYADGRVKHFETYVEGQAHGEVWSWHPNGQVAEYDLFEHDREIARKLWTHDGKPYFNYVYQDGAKVGVMGGSFCKNRKIAAAN